MNKYSPTEIEPRWQKVWEEKGIYQPDLMGAKKPFYNLMMFPYPSAEGLHVGNMYAFTGADIYGRFKRMQGYDVFEPIGLDGFGIHSENYAIKIGKHPAEQAKISEKNFYRQLHAIGNGFSWKNNLETYDPDYYRWTQWIFVQMFKHGLAYRKKSPVNFCPSCKTVLSDEQVIDGFCERCKSAVEKREMEQWYFRITKYADRLLKNLETLEWTNKVKVGQRNWIGRSDGVRIEFKIQNSKFKMDVFTTAHDTIYGATFMVLSAKHPLVEELAVKTPRGWQAESHDSPEVEEKEKSGFFTGFYCINPFNNEKIPIWIANYVLMEYGTGAIMGVPGHDARDHEFAQKYGLPIRPVIKPTDKVKHKAKIGKDGFWDYEEIKTRYATESVLYDSGILNGLSSQQAKVEIEREVEQRGLGKRVTQYKLRDWCISRQRYWGAPIPMIDCPKCGWVPVPEKDLPVLLPENVKDWKPEGTGKGPLAKIESFVNVACPECRGAARRETDVCDTFLDSSWYFLRYPSVKKGSGIRDQGSVSLKPETYNLTPKTLPWHPQVTKRWLPVTQYTGGAEHTVLHLLYSRFVTMALKDMGYLDFEEPFSHFYAHGLIIAEGAKMSKSRGNIVNPDEYIRKYGADTLRTYLMFLGPFDAGGDFRDTGIAGMYRFLNRVWRIVNDYISHVSSEKEKDNKNIPNTKYVIPNTNLTRFMHRTIKEVTEDLENLRYNTTIAHIMEYVNELQNYKSQITNPKQIQNSNDQNSKRLGFGAWNLEFAKVLLLLLAPFAPHMTEELWERITNYELRITNKNKREKLSRDSNFLIRASIHKTPWPTFDPKYLVEDEVTIVVQINGKTRDVIKVKSGKDTSDGGEATTSTPRAAGIAFGDARPRWRNQNEVEKIALASPKVQRYLFPQFPVSPSSSPSPRKIIFVPGKLINFVV